MILAMKCQEIVIKSMHHFKLGRVFHKSSYTKVNYNWVGTQNLCIMKCLMLISIYHTVYIKSGYLAN